MRKLFIFILILAIGNLAFPEEDLTPAQEAIYKADLKTISALTFDKVSPMHQKIFAAGIMKFYRDRVHAVRAGAYGKTVIAQMNLESRTIFLGPTYFEDQIPQMARLANLIHEAKHGEPKGWSHVWCSVPYSFVISGSSYRMEVLDGAPVPACDDTELGAYGVEYAFLRSIANSCTNCPEKMKIDARIISDMEALTRIANPAAAARLVRDANIDPAGALREFDHLARSYISSNLNFLDWFEKSERDGSWRN